MASLIKKNIRIFGFGKMASLFFVCLLFSLSGRSGSSLSFEQHILSAVSDHYYGTYALLPLTLLICFSFFNDDETFVIVRYRSYFSYFCTKWFGTGLFALLIILIQAAAALLSGIGLPFDNVWNLPSGAVDAELFSVLAQYFKSPLSAFLRYMVFQFVGIWVLHGLCMWIGHFIEVKWSLGILITLYVSAALWIKVPFLQKLPLTGINHLLILHHNLNNTGRLMITVTTVVLLIVVILWTVHNRWHSHLTFAFAFASGYGLLPYYLRKLASKRNLLVLCAVVVSLTLYKGFKNPCLETGAEWICFLFAGHGTGYLSILSFLEMLIMNGTALYLLAVFIENTVSGQSIFTSIRIKGRKELMNTILTAGTVFLFIYCLFWFAGGSIGTYLFGFLFDVKAAEYLICAVLLKFFDLLLQYLIMLVVYVCTKQITAGFLVLIAFNLFSIAPLSKMSYFPIGLSSMVRITLFDTESGIPVFLAFGLIFSFAQLIFLWLLKYGYKKLLD